MNLNELIEAEIRNGYGDANAQSKVCQDIILKAISESSLAGNITAKGGVVLRSKSGSIRRATQDLDLDFIKYSLGDKSIDRFISKLNCLNGIVLTRQGAIEELKQQDYHGKMDPVKLAICIKSYIVDDHKMRENGIEDIIKRLDMTFADRNYIQRINSTKSRWMEEDISDVIAGIKSVLEAVIL